MRWVSGRSITLLAFVVALGSIAIVPSPVQAGGGGGGSGGHDNSSCGVYPMAVKSRTLQGAQPGKHFDDVTTGTPSGHEGWLRWTSDVSEPALRKSLTYPGDSWRFVDPDDRSDRVLSIGDWVSGRPGSVSSSGVRQALDTLVGRSIILPVWDSTRGTGRNVAYHVGGFARFKITSYRLADDNKISATYLGPSTCTPASQGPVAQPTSASTAEDGPTTITLTGKSSAPRLTFRLTSPQFGTASLVGTPTCRRLQNGGDGDNNVTCTATASYTPAADYFGPDSFTFAVSDGHTESVPAAVSITVTEVNDPPIAGADSATVTSPGPLTLEAAALLANDVAGPANEADQALAVSDVTEGDDSHGTVTLVDGTITYTPDAGFSGAASFTYTVCDDGTTNGQPDPRCADGVVSVTVTAPNEPPVAEAATVDAVEDTAIPVTLAGSDPDGDELTFAVVSGPAHGTLSATAPELKYTPHPDYFGPDEFSFRVSDGQAESSPAEVSIVVDEVNDPPVAGSDSVSAQASEATAIEAATLLPNDTAGPANEADQTLAVTEATAGDDTHGTVTLVDGTITYTPDAGFSGTASFTYSICDDGTTGGAPDPQCTDTGTVTVNLAEPNQPPVADPATAEAVEDTAIPITLTGSDPDGDPLVFAVAGPANGKLSGTAPDLVYTPAPNYFGDDMFTFTVSDGHTTSVPATVAITISEVNDPPAAGSDSVPAPGHQPTSISAASLLANDTPGPSNEATQTPAVTAADESPESHGTVTLERGTITYVPDAGFAGPASFTYRVCDNGTTDALPDPRCADAVVSLTVAPAPNEPPTGEPRTLDVVEDTAQPVTLTGDDPEGDPVEFAIVSDPQHGTLSGTAPVLTYAPNSDYFGDDEFSFTTFDGHATSVPVAVEITVSEVNDPPVAGADSVDAVAGRVLTLDAATLVANDTPGPANESSQALRVTAVTRDAEAHGTVSLTDGTITYIPDAGFVGTATFTYRVCDDGTTGGASDPRCAGTGTVTVEVVAPNQPPVADGQSVTLAEDHPRALTLSGSDPDGDEITYEITKPPAHGALTGTAPALTYTPDADYYGPDSFTFTTKDAASSSPPATVDITVTEVNDRPVLGPDTRTLGGAGTLPPPPPPPSCGTPCGVIFGDPHLLTFDHAGYDAQAVGELIAAKSTTDDFEVQARFAPVPGTRTVSIDTAVAMRVAGHRVTMYRTETGMDTRIDGALVTPAAHPQPLPGGGTIGTYGLDDTVIVRWPDGSVAIVRAVGVFPEYYRFTVNLGLAPGRLGHVVGLLGDADGDELNDLVTRGGQPVTYPDTPFAELYGTYVNSWRISQAESLFDYGPGETTATFTDLTFPDAPVTLTAAARTRANNTCSLFGLTSPELLEACIVDVGVTGDPDFANSAADAQHTGLGIPTNTGQSSIGSATTIVTSTPGENAVRTFVGSAGQKVTLIASGSTFTNGGVDLTVRGPNNGFVASVFTSSATGFRDVFTLPSTGTYTITVDPSGQQTGTVTFLLSAVAEDTGETAIGTETTVTTETVGENPVRSFPATAGQKVTLRVSGSTFTNGGVDLTVRGPNNASVASVFTSSATGFRDVFTLPSTGTYTITVDPAGQQTGTVTFLISEVADNTGETAIGTATTVTTSTVGEDPVRSFPGTAGQKVTLRVSGSMFTNGGVNLTVRGPTNGFVASVFTSGATGFRDVFTLPSTGTYTITVDPAGQQIGTVTFLLSEVADDTGETAIGTATTVTTETVGENPVRSFSGTAGQKVTLRVSGSTFTNGGVELTVDDPTNDFVASLFTSGPTGFRDVFTLPSTGTYTITVDPAGQQTGTVTFLLSEVAEDTGATAIGTATTVTTETVGENPVRSFAGNAGQRLTLAVSGNTFSGGVDLTVRGPTGQFVAALFVAAPTGFRSAFTLPAAGTHTITIDPSGQQIGALTFLLANAPAGAAAADPITSEPAEEAKAEEADETGVAESRRTADNADLTAVVAAADPAPTLTLTVAELLANDRPGPANESAQTLTVTAVTPGSATHGTVTLANGIVTYAPDADFVGTASFTYRACDDGTTDSQPDPLCSDGSITVRVTANHPPTVDAKSVTTAEDTPVSLTLTGTDPDGDPVTFALDAAPARGTVAGIPPSLTYMPAPDANGADSFTVTANDGHDRSAPATVTVQVTEVNDPPVPHADTVTARAGQPITVPLPTLLANDDAGPFDERNQALSVTAVTPAPDTHGTVELTAGGVSYEPDAGFIGTSVVTYRVCDDGTTDGDADPHCADSTLSIALNRPPAAIDQAVQTSLTAPLRLTLTAVDPEGDTLTYAIATPPEHGTLSGTAPNVFYAATDGFVGSDSFTFTAADASGQSAPATVAITVVDVPAPVLEPDIATARAGTSLLVNTLANDAAGSGTIDAATLTVAAPPTRGTAAVESGRIRYTANAGASGTDTFAYTVCDSGGGCGTATVTVTITDNRAPNATDDTYDISAGSTLHPTAPGVLANDTDPDTGDRLQARLIRGVTNGRLLLYGTGAFTYTPNGPGIDTFVYQVVDSTGAVSNEATVTIYATGPAGPPIIGNDLYEVQQGRQLTVAAPGVLANDTSPNPRLALTVLLQRDAAKGTLLLQPDGSFVYTPLPGYTGVDQFSYLLRDSEGRVSREARVGITVTGGGPATATVGSTSPPDGATILGPTHFTATLVPPAGQTVTEWTVSYRHPGGSILVPLADGTGTSVAADFDPTLVRNGTYAIVIRAFTSGGGVLVSETGVIVEGEYKPGRYTTTYRDVALNSANIPIELFRTYDSTNKAGGELGVGWSLDLANVRIETNGPLGSGRWSTRTCGTFPFLETCYDSTKPHFVTVTWPDGSVERFRFVPNRGSSLVPNITTAGFVAEPGTTSTLEPVGNGLLLSGSDFLLGDFFSADGIYDPIQFVLTDKFGVKYRIDKRAGLLSITDRNGNVVSLGSDGIESSSGLSMTFVRDVDNRITSIVGPRGSIDYTYSTEGDLVEVNYPDGTTQTFTYDEDHNLETASGGGQLVRTVHYDDEGRVRAITDGNGHTATIDPDVEGHQQVSTDRTGRLTTVSTYNDRGNLIRQDQTYDGGTITTSATFDDVGRRLSATDGNGDTTRWTYDDAGNVLTQTDGNDHTTTYTYNDFGQVLTVRDASGRVWRNTYDDHGNLTSEIQPGGSTTTYEYDDDGLLISMTDPNEDTTTYTNDAAGHPETTTDPEGNLTRQQFEPETGWLMSVTDPNSAKTTMEYDAAGRLTKVTDANSHSQEFGFDEFGRLETVTDPLGKTLRRTYDNDDNVLSITDRNGDVITFDYDEEGRLLSKSVPGAHTSAYAYDPLGRLTDADNAAAELTFTYDDAGNVLTATTAGTATSPQPAVTLSYTYDDARRLTSVTAPWGATGYGFDDANRLTSVTAAAGGTYDFTYNLRGLLETMSRPNGVTDTLTYDDAAQLTARTSRLDEDVVGSSDYTYDRAGRRTSLTTPLGTASFDYDPGSQLVSATYPAATGVPAESFGYDLAGNRTSTATAPPGSFVHDDGNRLLADATSDYTYDSEGNTRSRTVRATGATTSYTWSAEHHLTRITYPDGTATTFEYDALGRRVGIDDAGDTARFVFDDQTVVAEYDDTNALAATFTHDSISHTSHLEMTRGGERYFYLFDALGSTTALTRLDGSVANRYTYDAFGNTTRTGTVANPFTFTGQLSHVKSGLVLFPERAYDPALGRFLTPDPVLSVNPYPYVENDPLNLLDPTGATIGSNFRNFAACAAVFASVMFGGNPAVAKPVREMAKCVIKIGQQAERRRKAIEAALKISKIRLLKDK